METCTTTCPSLTPLLHCGTSLQHALASLAAEEKSGIERTSNLMQIGTAVGPAAALAAVLYSPESFAQKGQSPESCSISTVPDMSLACCSLCLIGIGNAKAIQNRI